jgi:hypothetical protein
LGQLHPVSIVQGQCDGDTSYSLILVDDRLSAAKRIILIGHGPGVLGISELLEARSEHQSDLSFVGMP